MVSGVEGARKVYEGAYGTSEGVTGSDGGGGRLIKVGALDIAAVRRGLVVVRKVAGRAASSSSAVRASESAVVEFQQLARCSVCLVDEQRWREVEYQRWQKGKWRWFGDWCKRNNDLGFLQELWSRDDVPCCPPAYDVRPCVR